jgi:uncharacterized protein (TIGR02266 family)
MADLSKRELSQDAGEVRIKGFFEAIRELKRVEGELETPFGKGDPVLTAKAKELRAYKDVFLKAEAPRRPKFTVVERKADPNAPLKVELGFTTGVQFYEGLDLSLSKGGVFVKTEDLLPIDTLLDCEVRLEDEDIRFHVSAKVIWLNPRDTQGRPSGMGLKFFRQSSIQRQVLTDFMSGEMPAQALSHLSE